MACNNVSRTTVQAVIDSDAKTHNTSGIYGGNMVPTFINHSLEFLDSSLKSRDALDVSFLNLARTEFALSNPAGQDFIAKTRLQ